MYSSILIYGKNTTNNCDLIYGFVCSLWFDYYHSKGWIFVYFEAWISQFFYGFGLEVVGFIMTGACSNCVV